MATATRTVTEALESAKRASRRLATADSDTKGRALERLAELLGERADEVLEANAGDLADERASGLTEALRDRLTLTAERIEGMAAGVRAVAALPDPVGESLERRTLESGLDLVKMRVPLGVVAVIYEARPNVTVDCAALCIKSGNAIVLRGSSYAQRSNGALAALVREAVADAGLPEGAVELLSGDRSELEQLATAEGLVDLVIPRGGEGLKDALKAVATVPVMYAAAGNCHVYVHADADLEMARRIAFDAKVDRPGSATRRRRCSSTPRWRPSSFPRSSPDLERAQVELVGDGRAQAAAGTTPVGEATRGRLGHGVPGAEARRWRGRLARGGDRARQRARHRPLGGDRHRLRGRRCASSPTASMRPLSTSTPRPGSPTGSSSGWEPRSATRPRSCTRAGRSGCAS